MSAAFSLSSRWLAFAVVAMASSAPSLAAVRCVGYANPVPNTIILATPEMRMASIRTGACLSLDAQAFLDRARAEAATAVGATPSSQDPRMAGRFYMTQNGKRMTADDFDAWMKSKGIRVATGKTPTPPPPTPPPPPTSDD